MSYPKISFIIATYNVAETITDTIESIKNQIYPNFELIIVDGKSSDNTLEIVNRYKSYFGERLIVKSEKDKGVFDAWNKGLKLATGEWLAFVGGDDYLMQDYCRNHYEVISKNNRINFVSSINLFVSQNGIPLRLFGKSLNEKFNKYCTIAHVGCLHNKSLFDINGNFDVKFLIAGDYDFLLRARKNIVPYYMPKLSAIVRDGGVSNSNIKKVLKEQLIAKLKNKARSELMSYCDFLIALLKYYFRFYLNKYK